MQCSNNSLLFCTPVAVTQHAHTVILDSAKVASSPDLKHRFDFNLRPKLSGEALNQSCDLGLGGLGTRLYTHIYSSTIAPHTELD